MGFAEGVGDEAGDASALEADREPDATPEANAAAIAAEAAIALRLAPLVLHGVIQNNPELVALGLDRQAERALNALDHKDLPEEVRQASFWV